MKNFVCILVVFAVVLMITCTSGANSRGKSGLTEEELPQIETDVAVFPQLGAYGYC